MAGLSTAEFTNGMKIYYLGPLNDQVYRSHVLLDRLEKKEPVSMSGRHAYIPLISGRNPGVGSRKDVAGSGPKLPDPGRQSYANATFKMALHYGRGSVSGAVKRASRNNAGAFAEAMDAEMQGLMKSLPDDLNRQICGTGTGRAATLSQITAHSTQAGSTVIFVSANQHDGFSARVGDRVHFAARGAAVDTLTSPLPTSGTIISEISIDAVTSGSDKAHQITLAATTGTTVEDGTDAMYFGALDSGTLSAQDSSRSTEMYGLQALIDDGAIGGDMSDVGAAGETLTGSLTLGGIDRTAAGNAFWRSTVLKNPVTAGTLRPLTDGILQQAHLTATSLHGANPQDIEIYMNPGLWATLGLVQVAGRVYNDFKKTVEHGWMAIEVNGSMAFSDRDLPRNIMFFLNMTNIFLLTQGDYEFLDDDGNVLRVLSSGGRDAWEFSVNRDVQLGTNNLRTSVAVHDLEHSVELNSVLY